jgi:hypothetical protein
MIPQDSIYYLRTLEFHDDAGRSLSEWRFTTKYGDDTIARFHKVPGGELAVFANDTVPVKSAGHIAKAILKNRDREPVRELSVSTLGGGGEIQLDEVDVLVGQYLKLSRLLFSAP